MKRRRRGRAGGGARETAAATRRDAVHHCGGGASTARAPRPHNHNHNIIIINYHCYDRDLAPQSTQRKEKSSRKQGRRVWRLPDSLLVRARDTAPLRSLFNPHPIADCIHNIKMFARASTGASSAGPRAQGASSSPHCLVATTRPPSLLLPRRPPPPAMMAPRSMTTTTTTTTRTRAASRGSATLVPAAAAACKSGGAAPTTRNAADGDDGDDGDEPTPAQILAQVTRRIRDHGKAGRIRDAIAELASLSEKGMQPDRIAATALVAACAARPTPQNMTVAEGVFEELFGDGEEGGVETGAGEGPLLRPDEVTFAVLLRGYGAATPPLWPKIDATLGRMRRAFRIAPTATSYNALLESCVRTGDMDRAMDVVDRMADDGVEADAQTALICARKRALRAYARKALEI
jgi:pentatricopeptide repeat protein